MKNIYLAIMFILLFNISLVVAEQQTLGTFKQNTCINLLQTCANCTSVSISSVSYPDGTQAMDSDTMTKDGTEYNYTFCSTEQIGTYVVNGYGDPDGTTVVWAYDYEVTPSGFGNTLGFYFILILICGAVTGLGFAIGDGWFAVIGGLGFILVGLYSINFGIAGMRDMFITWGLGLFMIGTGSYIAINSLLEIINDNLN